MNQSLTIYRASAGSGKTFALAVEYIMELLQKGAENNFAQTLAVTFTNKATAEMKGRILETLYGLKTGLEETNDYLDVIKKRFEKRNVSITEEQIRERAGKALTAILHDYSHFRVETIDSFFQSILRNMARELGLAANLQVELSTEEIVDSAVDNLIESMSENEEIKKWVLDYVQDQLANGENWNIVRPLKDFAGNIFKEHYQTRSDEELNRISNSDVVKAFMKKMRDIRDQAKEEIQKEADRILRELPNSPIYDQISRVGDIEGFLRKIQALEKKAVTDPMRKKINGDETFLKKKYQDDTASLVEEEKLRQALQQLVDFYKHHLSAKLVLGHLSKLRLLRDIDRQARKIEGDTGRFTLSSTPIFLSKMIEGSDAPFIFEKIGTYINNVMIDEFQDTSNMQWENFRTLLLEKVSSGGKGMLFGDIKQSIYRWRNGDWRILYKLAEELKAQGIEPESLDTNYRSHQIIVDFNNSFFPKAAELLDAMNPDADIKLKGIYSDVEQKKKKEDGKGYVRIKIYKKGEDDTIRDMVEQIRLLQKGGLSLSEIGILVRKNGNAQTLLNGFSQLAPDIPLVSDEAFLLDASTSVQMIVAAMRVLIDKHHKNIVSEKYLMLHYLQDVLGQEKTTIQSVALQKKEQVLPEEFTKHQEELLQLPLYLLAEKLWRIFSLGNIQGEDVYVLTFFDELQKHLRNATAPDIQTFLEAWDEKIHKSSVPGSSVNGIRILTIHKSKGLAFHTVLLPFSEWLIESDLSNNVLWCKTNQAPYNELGALPISIQSNDVKTSVFAPAYEEEHLERRVDALNMLYVAFTRAKANLYVWGNLIPQKNFYTAAQLIYDSLRNDDNDKAEECFTFEKGAPVMEAKKEDEKKNRLSMQYFDKDAIDVKVITRDPNLDFRQSNQAQSYLEQMATNDGQQNTDIKLSQREIGIRMHEVLSRVNDVNQLGEVLNQASKEGLIDDSEDWDAITTRIKEGFQDPLVASWFKAENIVYNECSIAGINKDGQPDVLRPDRVVMNGKCISVIDYKFGHPSGFYVTQVQAYMDFMHRMYPDHEIKGYLWYVMGKGAVPVYKS